MTISSLAESGGGLADVGAFAREKVYTVYLDMRGNNVEHGPSWTLQYARLRPAAEREGQSAHKPSPLLSHEQGDARVEFRVDSKIFS